MLQINKAPVLRFPGFSNCWSTKKLEEITTYVDYRGKTPSKSDNGVFLVTAKNIRMGYIDYETSKEYIPSEAYSEVMCRGLPSIGDVLITTEAPLGNIASVDRENIALAQRVIKLRGTPNIICNDFLKHLLLSSKFQKTLIERATGGTVQGIKGSILHKILLTFPSFAEQEKIANFLTSVDYKIQQLTKKKQLLEQYKKSAIQKIFNQLIRFKDDNGIDYPNWVSKQLSDVCKIYDGTHMTPDYKEHGIPFYSVEHITSDDFRETKYIAEDVFEKENKRVKLEKGDILMTRIGDIGTSKYISWEVNASFYVSLALLKGIGKINMLFLDQYMKTDKFQKELHKRTIHVAFPKKINLGEIGNCSIEEPTIQEQVKISTFLTSIDEKIKQVSIQLENSQVYKKSLLQQMLV